MAVGASFLDQVDRSFERAAAFTGHDATLLANISATELGISLQNGQSIGLDPETSVSFQNARTIGELAALVDRMLVRGRGNFATANRAMQAVNSGRGIGPVCNE